MTDLYFGQRIDPENGLIECWFATPALDEIKLMDLTDKVIIMFGAGMGDVWLSRRCKELHVVERNRHGGWLEKCIENKKANNADKLIYHLVPVDDCHGHDKEYLDILNHINADVIISDDAYRYEVVERAIPYFKNKGGGILICDNYWQDYIWKSPKAIDLLKPFEKHIHSQPNHVDYEEEGCEWKTAIIFIK